MVFILREDAPLCFSLQLKNIPFGLLINTTNKSRCFVLPNAEYKKNIKQFSVQRESESISDPLPRRGLILIKKACERGKVDSYEDNE